MRFSFNRSSPIRTGMETTVYPVLLTDIVTSDLKRHSEIDSPTIPPRPGAARHRPVHIHFFHWRHAHAPRSKRSAAVRRVRDGHAHATAHADPATPQPRFGSSRDAALVPSVDRDTGQVRVDADGQAIEPPAWRSGDGDSRSRPP